MAKTKTNTRTKKVVKQITRSAEVREQILGIQEQKEKGYVNLALLLYEAYTGKYAVEWGYKDFRSYAENELATQYRKALNFVEIGEVVTNLGLPKSRLEKIGWSKLCLLAPILTRENMEEWLQQAEEITHRELAEVTRKERVERGDLNDRPKVVKLTIKMSEAEAGVIESAIDDAKKLTNSENTTVALEMICSDWMETRGTTPGKANLDDHITYLEKVYGCKLVLREEKIAVPPEHVEVEEKVKKPKKKRKTRSDKGTKVGHSDKPEVLGKTESAAVLDEKSFEEEAVLENTEGSSTGDKELDDLLGL